MAPQTKQETSVFWKGWSDDHRRKFQNISAETVSSTDDDSKSDDMAEYYKSPTSSFPNIRSGSAGRFIWYFSIPAQTYSHLTLCLSGQFIWNMSATFFDPTIHSLFFWWKCSAFQHYLNCVLVIFTSWPKFHPLKQQLIIWHKMWKIFLLWKLISETLLD